MGWNEYGYNYDGWNAKKMFPTTKEVPILPTDERTIVESKQVLDSIRDSNDYMPESKKPYEFKGKMGNGDMELDRYELSLNVAHEAPPC